MGPLGGRARAGPGARGLAGRLPRVGGSVVRSRHGDREHPRPRGDRALDTALRARRRVGQRGLLRALRRARDGRLTSRTEARRWQSYLDSKVRTSLGTGRIAALWVAAFLAVYREGAETVLFYHALLAGTEDARAVLAGLGIGALVLMGLFVLLRTGARRVPMHAFFAWTSLLLYTMAFVFAGRGMRALQAAGAIGASPTPWGVALDWVGLYPTWESTGVQLALLVAAAVALLAVLVGRRRSGEHGAPVNISPKGDV